jgi:hypothetical protein
MTQVSALGDDCRNRLAALSQVLWLESPGRPLQGFAGSLVTILRSTRTELIGGAAVSNIP